MDPRDVFMSGVPFNAINLFRYSVLFIVLILDSLISENEFFSFSESGQ